MPFQVPPGTVAWKVRKYTGGRGRPPVVFDDHGPAHLDLEAGMDELRVIVKNEPGWYRLYPVNEAGEELTPIACIEITLPEEDGQLAVVGDRTIATAQVTQLPGLVAQVDVMELCRQMMASRDAHDQLMANMLTTMVQSTANIQQGMASLLAVTNNTIKVANGLDAVKRLPAPPDTEELAEKLADLLTEDEEEDSGKDKKSIGGFISEMMKGPLGGMAAQMLGGFNNAIQRGQQAKTEIAQSQARVAKAQADAAQAQAEAVVAEAERVKAEAAAAKKYAEQVGEELAEDHEAEDQEPDDQAEDQEPDDQEPDDQAEDQEPDDQEPDDQEPDDQEPDDQEPDDQEPGSKAETAETPVVPEPTPAPEPVPEPEPGSDPAAQLAPEPLTDQAPEPAGSAPESRSGDDPDLPEPDESEPSEPEVMNVAQVARLLGCDRKTIYDAVSRMDIPHQRLGRRVIFSRTAVLDWLRCKGSSEGNPT